MIDPSDLLDRLARAADQPGTAAAALRALAAVAPGAAATWLRTHADAARGEIPTADLAEVVVRCGARDLLIRYADALPPEALVGGVGALTPEERAAPELRAAVDAALRRAPRDAELLRLAADLAVAQGDAPTAHALLTRLARADDRQATVRHVWRQRETLVAPTGTATRLALLSSFTIDPLVPYLDLECRALGLAPHVYVAPFNSWTQEIVAPDSGLRRFDPEVAFLSVALDDLVPELAGGLDGVALAQAGETALERVGAAARRFAAECNGTLVVHAFASAHPDPLGILAGRAAPSRSAWIAGLNARLQEMLAPLPRVFLLDLPDVLLRRSDGPIDNPKMRHLGAMRLGERTLGDVARAYVRYVAPVKGLTRKCVVLDLDNTLWGGVVGEEGVAGIKLGHTAPGSEYVEFQHYLRTLTDRGFLLALNSKNNPDDALEAIRGHEAMVLRETAFSAIRINWRPKPENMQAIAAELDIGLDALIFVDDNPEERELMRQVLPQVLTVELPPDPSRYRATVEGLPHLQTLALTEEDRTRAAQYRSKRERDQLRDTSGSLEDYLRSLEIVADIGRAGEADLPRVHQLFQRTNQFNLTTRRYAAGELSQAARDSATRLYVLRARDRFGDHGLVATALARCGKDAWTVDSLLMSCRVIGYGIETALLAQVCRDARDAGATAIVGEFVPTKKNAPARDFYERHGFTPDGALDGTDGGSRWHRPLSDGGVTSPAWVTVEAIHGS